MKLPLLERIFFKIKDNVQETGDNQMSLSVELVPRFGRIGLFVWYFLDEIRQTVKIHQLNKFKNYIMKESLDDYNPFKGEENENNQNRIKTL